MCKSITQVCLALPHRYSLILLKLISNLTNVIIRGEHVTLRLRKKYQNLAEFKPTDFYSLGRHLTPELFTSVPNSDFVIIDYRNLIHKLYLFTFILHSGDILLNVRFATCCWPVFIYFSDSFVKGIDRGASFAAYYKGQLVVNLCGGLADVNAKRPWKEDTVGFFYSTTKFVACVTVAHMIERYLVK